MTEWKEYKLGEIAEIITGYPFPGDKYESTGNLRVVRGENVTIGNLRWDTEKHWNHETEGLEKYFLQSGDIVIGMDGSRVGDNRAKVKQVDLPLILAQRVACLRAKKEFSQDYLWYTIFSDNFKKYIEAIHTGTSIPHISQKQIEDFEILFPPLPTQRRIASILSSLDDKIDLLHRENATLEQMAETMFRQWFVVEAKEEWEEVRLEDIAILNAGGDKPKNVSPIRTKDLSVPIYSNGIDNEGLYGYTDTAKILVESVTISARGTIGFVVLRTEPFVPIVRLITIQPKDFVTSKFLYFWAKNQNINGTGTTQQQLTVPDFKQTKLLLPEKALIDKFTNIANQYYNKILLNKQQMQSLIQTRDVLLEKLMNNEIKIL